MRLDNIVIDGATTRLIAAARAVQAAEHLPKESARTLVALSRGCRLYLEARQRPLALRCLKELDDLMAGAPEADLRDAFTALVESVRKEASKR